MNSSLLGLISRFVVVIFLFQSFPVGAVEEDMTANVSIESTSLMAEQGREWHPNWQGKNVRTYSHPQEKTYKAQIFRFKSGNVQFYTDELPVSQSGSYEYTDYISANVPTGLLVRYKKTNGTYSFERLGSLPMSNSGMKITFRLSPPERTESYSVIHELSSLGYMELGDYKSTLLAEDARPLTFFLRPSLTPKVSPYAGKYNGSANGGYGGGGASNIVTPIITPSLTGSTSTGTVTNTGTSSTGSTATGTTSTGSTSTGSTATGSTSDNNETCEGGRDNGGSRHWWNRWKRYHRSDDCNNDSTTNTGSTSTGGTSTGSTNSGTTNTGSTSTGSTNTGSTSTGSTSTGSTSTGSTSTGTTSTGGTSTGSTNNGGTNTGTTTNTGSTNTGSTSTGSTSTGSTSTGSTNTGSTSTGGTSTGSTSTGTTNTGSTSTGSTSTGSTNTGSTSTGSTRICPVNLIANACLEDSTITPGVPDYWGIGGYGNNDRTFVYPTEGSIEKGAQLSITSFTDGDAKWYFDSVAVTPLDTYTYTESYKSDVPTTLTAQYTNTDGTFSYQWLASLPASGTWAPTSVNIDIPAGVTALTIFHVLNSIGSLSIDETSLVKSQSYVDTTFDHGMMTFSFDDGWTSQLDNAIPLLDANGIKGTFAIITGEMLAADAVTNHTYMTTAETLSLQASGHEIAVHTIDHVDLTTLSESDMITNLQTSRDTLLNNGFSPVTTLVYPYGMYNTSIVQTAKNLGFTTARAVNPGYNKKNTDKYALYGQNQIATTTFEEIKGWIDTAIADKTWLVLNLHEVDVSGRAYSIDPALLEQVVAYVKSTGIETVTLSEGVSRMNP